MEKAKAEAAARETALANRAEAAKRRARESINYAHDQQREMAASLKSVQAALEKAIQERDNALRLEQAAQARADREAAARQAAERRAEKRGRRLFGSRKEEPDTQEIK